MKYRGTAARSSESYLWNAWDVQPPQICKGEHEVVSYKITSCFRGKCFHQYTLTRLSGIWQLGSFFSTLWSLFFVTMRFQFIISFFAFTLVLGQGKTSQRLDTSGLIGFILSHVPKSRRPVLVDRCTNHSKLCSDYLHSLSHSHLRLLGSDVALLGDCQELYCYFYLSNFNRSFEYLCFYFPKNRLTCWKPLLAGFPWGTRTANNTNPCKLFSS